MQGMFPQLAIRVHIPPADLKASPSEVAHKQSDNAANRNAMAEHCQPKTEQAIGAGSSCNNLCNI